MLDWQLCQICYPLEIKLLLLLLSRSGLIWFCTVCLDLSVPKLRVITVARGQVCRIWPLAIKLVSHTEFYMPHKLSAHCKLIQDQFIKFLANQPLWNKSQLT